MTSLYLRWSSLQFMTIKLFNIDWRILNNVINSFILDVAGVVGPLLGESSFVWSTSLQTTSW